MKTVGLLKDSIAGLLTGTNLNNVTNLNGAIERAARVMAQQVDIPEASGRQNMMLYSGVYDYLAPTSIFGGALVDIRPQGVTRNPMDEVYRVPIVQFDVTKASLPNGYNVTFEYDKGTPIMRVAQVHAPASTQIDPMNDNSGWTPTGIAGGVATDAVTYYKAPSSLRFDLTDAIDADITKTISPLDLSTYNNVGVVFLAVYLPTTTGLTDITLSIGSDITNYYSITQTVNTLGKLDAGKWQLFAFDLVGATATGSPDMNNITIIDVAFTHTQSILNVRVGELFASLPSPHEILFQSSYIFKVGDVLSNTIVEDTDEILLNDAAYTLLEYEGAAQVGFQMGGDLSSGSLQLIDARLNGKGNDMGLYARYRGDNPSAELRMVGSYYD